MRQFPVESGDQPTFWRWFEPLKRPHQHPPHNNLYCFGHLLIPNKFPPLQNDFGTNGVVYDPIREFHPKNRFITTHLAVG